MNTVKISACPPRLRAFGRDLHDWLISENGRFATLPADYALWIKDGRWILAEALHAWIGKGSSVLGLYSWVFDPDRSTRRDGYRRDSEAEHVVAHMAGFCLDENGVFSKKEVCHRWREEKQGHMNWVQISLPGLYPFRREDAGDMECPASAVRDLVKALMSRFGDGHQIVRWAARNK